MTNNKFNKKIWAITPTNTRFADFDECKTEEEQSCKEKILTSLINGILFNKSDVCNGDLKPPCVVQEYLPKDYTAPVDINGLNGFNFEVAFYPPLSSRSAIEFRPLKTIYTERYVLDELQLIGTVGGTFGLMIGFSFMGCIESISDFALGLIKREKRRQH